MLSCLFFYMPFWEKFVAVIFSVLKIGLWDLVDCCFTESVGACFKLELSIISCLNYHPLAPGSLVTRGYGCIL